MGFSALFIYPGCVCYNFDNGPKPEYTKLAIVSSFSLSNYLVLDLVFVRL